MKSTNKEIIIASVFALALLTAVILGNLAVFNLI